jgi:hypothetical protein
MNEINIRLYTTILIDKQSVYLSLQTVYIDRQTDRQTDSLSNKDSCIQTDTNFTHSLHFWAEIN